MAHKREPLPWIKIELCVQFCMIDQRHKQSIESCGYIVHDLLLKRFVSFHL